VDPKRSTPAHTKRDGVDYVPTRLPVLFGHHFASIAGAGPIVGPVAAAYLGWGPVVLWIIFGCIFIGAMHDFAALFLSIRHEGRSIGSVIEDYLGVPGKIIFLLFCWVTLVLIVAVFAILVAKTFVKTPEVATASLLFIAIAPIFGWLVTRKGVSIITASIIFVPMLFFFIWVGTLIPMDLKSIQLFSKPICSTDLQAIRIWLVVLFVYVSAASIIPVWMLLQPRDYLNSYLLYAMVILGFLGIMLTHPTFNMPAFVGWSAINAKGSVGSIFPILYVTVACGACSGFHALVSSGTTSKQLNSEKDIKTIGYGAMLVEGVVALMALTSVAVLTKGHYMESLKAGDAITAFATGLASFSVKLGLPHTVGITFFALTISAFMLTTLDTATRLARFTWQELFITTHKQNTKQSLPKWKAIVAHPISSTLLAVIIAGPLAFSGSVWQIWPIFGASNQMLAAITLLVVTLMLAHHKINFWIALIPMMFMSLITIWALVALLKRNLGSDGHLLLAGATSLLLVMALTVAAMAVFSLRKNNRA
jgi:carbon starvation protein